MQCARSDRIKSQPSRVQLWFDRFRVVERAVTKRVAGLGVEQVNRVFGNPRDNRLVGFDTAESADCRHERPGLLHVEFVCG
jgi:hypothetical protein